MKMNMKLVTTGLLAAMCAFGGVANAASTTSAEFVPTSGANWPSIENDGYAVYNVNTATAVLVEAPLGLKVLTGAGSFEVRVDIDNGTDGKITSCAAHGRSRIHNFVSSGVANTSLQGNQTLLITVNYQNHGSGDPTFFTLQCSLPRANVSAHGIYGAISPVEMTR